MEEAQDLDNGTENSFQYFKVARRRQNHDKWAAAVVITILVIVEGGILFSVEEVPAILKDMLSENWNAQFFIVMLATMLLAQLVAELLRRMCLFWEETYHLETRYRKSGKSALLASLSIDSKTAVVLSGIAFVCLCVVVLYSGTYGISCFLLIPFYCIAYLLMHVLGLSKPKKSDLLNVSDAQTNFGQAFAWQYYFGYLQIILPDFLERVKEFEEEEKIRINIHKLFILIPESCHSPDLFSNHHADLGILECVKNLREVCRDRNGTRARVYKNPVYRINGEEPIYCCVESAAIINSLDEMCEKEALTGVTEVKKHEHLMSFCSALKDILKNDKALGSLVQLVFYKDIDETGYQIRIADVIKRSIGLILRQQ